VAGRRTAVDSTAAVPSALARIVRGRTAAIAGTSGSRGTEGHASSTAAATARRGRTAGPATGPRVARAARAGTARRAAGRVAGRPVRDGRTVATGRGSASSGRGRPPVRTTSGVGASGHPLTARQGATTATAVVRARTGVVPAAARPAAASAATGGAAARLVATRPATGPVTVGPVVTGGTATTARRAGRPTVGIAVWAVGKAPGASHPVGIRAATTTADRATAVAARAAVPPEMTA
jgi:hypothetical protein